MWGVLASNSSVTAQQFKQAVPLVRKIKGFVISDNKRGLLGRPSENLLHLGLLADSRSTFFPCSASPYPLESECRKPFSLIPPCCQRGSMPGSSQGVHFPTVRATWSKLSLSLALAVSPPLGWQRRRGRPCCPRPGAVPEPQAAQPPRSLPQHPGNSQQEKPAAASCRSVCYDCLLFFFFLVGARCLFVRVIHSPGLGGSWSVPRVTMVPESPWVT